ncbi:bifunctional ADP-dependent NAD(P)H-hydrate dehydratase/NAD(P)H-hydrate epimerase [Rothia uropygialis]|uniref:bifunctional ADP-dependent NAD(P)H-hydrate dehydratase/NAD(P)H-hydrate epimerase n=1 Tax=Kocuria sp. 36 TaxID=1415402 RepID=UPI00101C580F|nr:bifunctional ADP-dependent NAD(P)H-hydrate dehydratase/NAD(P)H-hydrate epimerase [Kocuria sp. 36]
MGLKTYTARQIKETEKPHVDAGVPLMERASHGLGETAARLLAERTGTAFGKRALLLIGKGNNGGDALFAGAFLRSEGMKVTALLTEGDCHEQGRNAFEEAGGDIIGLSSMPSADAVGIALEKLQHADLIVDGILGTGGRGGLRGLAQEVVQGITAELTRTRRGMETGSRRRPLIIACDAPSGLDATTGQVFGPVLPADVTITFIGAKTGLVATPSRSLVGKIVVLDLGISEGLPESTVQVLQNSDFPTAWPLPREGDQKYSRGVLGTVVGSDEFPGAGLMCIRAAINAGTGMVRYTGGDFLAGTVAVSCPEAVRTESVGAHRVQAWAIGSGATGSDREHDIRHAIDSGLPLVADAAAIDILARDAADGVRASPNVLMTPHAGELAQALEWFSRLRTRGSFELAEAAEQSGWPHGDFPEEGFPSRDHIEASPLVWARTAQKVLGGTILLKGATTVVAGPSTAWVHSGNSNWLSTAGSGDTLTGILGAGISALAARVENGGADSDDVDSWGRVAAAGLLVQRAMSTLSPGPVPPTIAAARIPEALGRLAGQ